jgi:hypothetical protein
MILCEWDTPEGHPGQYCVHLYAFVSYRRLSSQFQFSLSVVTLVCVSISVVQTIPSPRAGQDAGQGQHYTVSFRLIAPLYTLFAAMGLTFLRLR